MAIKLRELEKRAYTSYYNDGLFEIFLGAVILCVGVAIAFDAAYYFALIAVLAVTSWAGAKRALTVPRMGHVRFGPERRARIVREKVVFQIYFAMTAIAGLVVFFLFTRGIRGRVMDFFRIAPFGPIGLIGAFAIVILGYFKEIRRLYLYAALVVVAVFGGPALGLSPLHYLGAPGLLMLLIGSVMLTGFIRRYPKTGEGVDHGTR